MRGWIIYIFLAACCVIVSGKQEKDRFKHTIATRHVKARCIFSLVVVGRKVLRRKSKVSCKKIKQDRRVKNYKISSPVSRKTFILTLVLKKKGGKAVLRKATVRPGKPVLLIGPSPELEVLTLPSLLKHSCNPPTHPQSGLGGYIATVTEGADALVCGGYSGGYKNTCYTLQLGGGWTQASSMLEPRSGAAAIPVHNGVWVTGGWTRAYVYTATTEVLSKGTWQYSVNLPRALFGHCLVKINDSHSVLAGGEDSDWNTRGETYLYSTKDGFVQLPDIEPRIYSACGLINGLVYVIGGRPALRTVEYFSPQTMTWSRGTDMAVDIDGAELVSVDDTALLVGGKYTPRDIYTLNKSGQWEKISTLTYDKSYFKTLTMKIAACG